MAEQRKRVGDAVAEAARKGEEAVKDRRTRRGGRPSDALGGDIRRRDMFPLLVLHLVSQEETYGNHLIEAIEEMTEGVISVNPNTIYPLLRQMESDDIRSRGAGSTPTAAPAAIAPSPPRAARSTSASGRRWSHSSTRSSAASP